jgi:RNA polymerase sigma factor (sigma-70 family)
MKASIPTRRKGGAPASNPLTDHYEEVTRAARVAARRRLGATTLVDDVVAETLVRMVERWDRLAGHENLAGWAARCADLVGLEVLRREQRAGVPEPAAGAAEAAPDPDVGARVAVSDELAAALAMLSPRQRSVMTLRYLEDLDEATTASRLGLSAANVRAAAHEGRARLRRLLAA